MQQIETKSYFYVLFETGLHLNLLVQPVYLELQNHSLNEKVAVFAL